jgi:hypothetical protein
MRISRQKSLIQNTIDQKQLENVEYFNYLGSLITNDAKRAHKMKTRTAMAKAAFNKETLFTSKLDINLRKTLVQCYILNTALHGAETWTFQKVDQKYLKSFEMWCWRRMEKISLTDHVRYEEVLQRVWEERNILRTIKKRRLSGLVTSCVGTAFSYTLLKDKWREG